MSALCFRWIIGLSLLLPLATTAIIPVFSADEFIGPFPSWTLVTSYRTAGDGRTDDTAAIQKALDELGRADHSPVLFFPSGTYRITKTLTLSYTVSISIVGDNPETTTIVWDGATGGTMLSVNGVAY